MLDALRAFLVIRFAHASIVRKLPADLSDHAKWAAFNWAWNIVNNQTGGVEKIADAGNKACAVAKRAVEKYCLTDKVTKGIDAVVQKGKEIDEKHSLTDKVVKGVDAAVQKGKAIDERHGIGDKVTQGVSTVLQKGKDIDDKHQVTDKVSSGVTMGMDRISGWLGRQNQNVAQSTSDAANRS